MTGDQLSGAVVSVAGGFGLAEALTYFGINGEVLLILSVLLALDYIFGVTNAYITDRLSVTSAKMRRGLAKKLTRRCLPLIVILILKGLGVGDMEMATTVVFSILIITEGYSIIGHIYSINTGKQLPEIDAFEMLINFVVELVKGKMPKVEKRIDK